MNFDTLRNDVLGWAKARRIVPNAKAATQLMKTGSELGELFDAEIKGDLAGIVDGVGDVLVTLIIYCELRKIDIVGCLHAAHLEIKDRTGTLLPNGCFIKDEPSTKDKIIAAIHREESPAIIAGLNAQLGGGK